MNNLFDVICQKLIPPVEDGDQWLPLVRKLVWHKLNVLSQRYLYSDVEYSTIRDSTWEEAKLLLLPPVKDAAIDIVALEAWTRGYFFEMFKFESIQAEAARIFRTTCRDDTGFYNSCVILLWEYRIFQRYYKELARRFANDKMKRDLFGMMIGRNDATQWLIRQFSQYTQGISLPEDERKHAVLYSLYQHTEELSETPLYELQEKIALTPTVVWRDVDDERRTQHTKGRYPEGGFEYMDAAEEGKSGKTTSVLQFLEAKYESLQIQPKEIDEGITQEQRKQLELLLGDNGRKILEYRLQHPEIVGQHGEKKIIAQALGIAESTVGEYIGRKKHDGTKHVGILEKKAEAILRII